MAVGLQAHLLFQAGGDQSRLPAQATDFGKIIKGLERPAFPPPQVLAPLTLLQNPLLVFFFYVALCL